MKQKHILALGIALGFSQMALSVEPAAPGAHIPDAHSLGTIEGIFNKCSEIDPAHAGEYRDRAKKATEGASDNAVSAIRDSDAYKEAYESVSGSIVAGNVKDALKACTGSLAPGQ